MKVFSRRRKVQVTTLIPSRVNPLTSNLTPTFMSAALISPLLIARKPLLVHSFCVLDPTGLSSFWNGWVWK